MAAWVAMPPTINSSRCENTPGVEWPKNKPPITSREREMILDLFEEVTGARFHYNSHTLGGNRHDLPAGWKQPTPRM